MPLKVEGVDYTPAGINALREDLIQMRDEQFHHWPEGINATLVLSHTLALLAYLAELVQDQADV